MRISLRDVAKRFGGVTAVDRATLEIADGELFTLLGPSGCGKTTLLRLVAGLATPDSGEVRFGERRVDRLPVYQRNIGMVFQNYALWPHMTVRANVTYGLKLRRLPAVEIERRLAAGLRQVNLVGLEQRYPGQLSGGQQQRVALARALVLNPDILLLDEPLSNLDAKIRVQVRAEIRKLQQELGITTIYVTHDQEEALSLSDRVAVMREGHVLQVAAPKALYERPATRFVADFVGTNNVVAGVCRDRADGLVVVDTPMGRVQGRLANEVRPGQRCVIAVRPENIAFAPGHHARAPGHHLRASGDRILAPGHHTLGPSADNTVDGRIVLASYLGNTVRYDVETAGGGAMKVDVRDPWHHEVMPRGHAVRLTFPASVALALLDD
jgi:ABC-type Fe3+/spermidine/putrescine transport system ATPase subunit